MKAGLLRLNLPVLISSRLLVDHSLLLLRVIPCGSLEIFFLCGFFFLSAKLLLSRTSEFLFNLLSLSSIFSFLIFILFFKTVSFGGFVSLVVVLDTEDLSCNCWDFCFHFWLQPLSVKAIETSTLMLLLSASFPAGHVCICGILHHAQPAVLANKSQLYCGGERP